MPPWDAPSGNQLSSVFDVDRDAQEQQDLKEQAKAVALRNKAAKPKKPVEAKPADDDRPASVIQGAVSARETKSTKPSGPAFCKVPTNRPSSRKRPRPWRVSCHLRPRWSCTTRPA